jgi:adenine/guanine phosphoribosyltransferase-like PRPP-binding protein
MLEYTAKHTLRIAKRHKNTKRTYLLVNPLQAKHIPVSPTASLNMMRCLGENLAQKYLNTKLVIGFAETATAIGAAVAGSLGGNCIYIHTTREEIPNVNNWLYFLEEHSHGVEQKICGDNIQEWLQNTPQIIFVDDELSTGKTIINIVDQLRRQYPALEGTRMIAASIMNHLTPENTERLTAAGIISEYLVKLPNVDYSAELLDIETTPAKAITGAQNSSNKYRVLLSSEPFMNPRLGVYIGQYEESCSRIMKNAIVELADLIQPDSNILVLGTEECMYPALILGEELERQSFARSVACHSTTRSPIGICNRDGYPITEGYMLHSFYDMNRETYLYELNHYNAVIVVSDTLNTEEAAIYDVAALLQSYGDSQLFFLRGGCHV